MLITMKTIVDKQEFSFYYANTQPHAVSFLIPKNLYQAGMEL